MRLAINMPMSEYGKSHSAHLNRAYYYYYYYCYYYYYYYYE